MTKLGLGLRIMGTLIIAFISIFLLIYGTSYTNKNIAKNANPIKQEEPTPAPAPATPTKRFITIESQVEPSLMIIKDTKTGILYLDNGRGITPLLDNIDK